MRADYVDHLLHVCDLLLSLDAEAVWFPCCAFCAWLHARQPPCTVMLHEDSKVWCDSFRTPQEGGRT